MKSTKSFIQNGFLLGLCLFAFTVSMQAQVLDLQSTTEGLLVPRMTTAQKDAIPTPDQGLLVYDIETMSFWYYDDLRWNEVSNGLSDQDQDTEVFVEKFIDEDKIRMVAAGTEVMQLTSDAVTVSPNNFRIMEVDSFGTFLGRWNSGHPGLSSQLTLSGLFNVGVNNGLFDSTNPSFGTTKLLIEGYQNDGPVVYPIYVKDENNLVDFFIRNKLSPSGRSLMYFQGNMAIGSENWASSDSLYRLSVDGKIACEGVLVDLSVDWPDYVFESDYDLKTLAQVRTFIQENGHLPGVPSAQEVEDHGLDLEEMNTILMEKVEELTLYILQQQDQLKDQQDGIIEMKKHFEARFRLLEKNQSK